MPKPNKRDTAIGHAIRHFRKLKDWDRDELARKMGRIHGSWIQRREDGTKPVPRHEWKRFAEVFEITLEEFEREFRQYFTIDRPVYEVGKIPLINHTPAGPTMDYEAWSQAGDEGYEYICRGDIEDDRAFAVTVVGASMEPTLREKDVVVLSPIRPESGADLRDMLETVCFVRVGERSSSPGVFLARLVAIEEDDDNVLVFSKDNPRHAGVRVLAGDVERMAQAVEIRRKGPL